ncbi:hypothetical protein BDP81DRAFT_515381 [Colletotrichum phormii]|uniref:Zn(2)-C6 fungal-type domain-containing protein n=1 Tax=Colletotrichum phormii TaxID=359342 RepID=A0AAJ0EIE6_9PEZI|nr:uncharacterized protein BDP81DRAFT_515381 [Colletotrichum phormii]KAK1638006.1 hypothetical protein BDP81DRAFT_515381 [Colletotrichum phormii]
MFGTWKYDRQNRGGTIRQTFERANLRPTPQQACNTCRAKKMKCTGEKTGCSRCKALDSPCQYTKPSERVRASRKDRTSAKKRPASTGPKDDVEKAAEAELLKPPSPVDIGERATTTHIPDDAAERQDAVGWSASACYPTGPAAMDWPMLTDSATAGPADETADDLLLQCFSEDGHRPQFSPRKVSSKMGSIDLAWMDGWRDSVTQENEAGPSHHTAWPGQETGQAKVPSATTPTGRLLPTLSAETIREDSPCKAALPPEQETGMRTPKRGTRSPANGCQCLPRVVLLLDEFETSLNGSDGPDMPGSSSETSYQTQNKHQHQHQQRQHALESTLATLKEPLSHARAMRGCSACNCKQENMTLLTFLISRLADLLNTTSASLDVCSRSARTGEARGWLGNVVVGEYEVDSDTEWESIMGSLALLHLQRLGLLIESMGNLPTIANSESLQRRLAAAESKLTATRVRLCL